MKTIRHNVFETNSSSCHSFTISDTRAFNPADYPTMHCNGDGEYGWSGPTVCTPHELLNYSAVAFGALYVQEDWEYDEKEQYHHSRYVVKEYDEYRDAIENVVKYFKEHGVELVFDYPTEDGVFIPTGYIDHQSGPYEDSDCRRIANLWKDPEALFNFVFSNSEIEIDNDNH